MFEENYLGSKITIKPFMMDKEVYIDNKYFGWYLSSAAAEKAARKEIERRIEKGENKT